MSNDDQAFDRTTEQGRDDGLFRACMTAIRSAHLRANRLRAGLTLAGLFTDVAVYRETLAMFYVPTCALEKQLLALKGKDPIVDKLLSLGHHFTSGYEKDLAVLFGDRWREDVENLVTQYECVTDYRRSINTMDSGSDLAGAVFVLWGALIIGGGAAAQPRVKSLVGSTAVNVFESVTGAAGRVERRNSFVKVWDELAKPSSPEFAKTVESTRNCMQYNNDIFASLQRNPWWYSYLLASGIALGSIGVYVVLKNCRN